MNLMSIAFGKKWKKKTLLSNNNSLEISVMLNICDIFCIVICSEMFKLCKCVLIVVKAN